MKNILLAGLTATVLTLVLVVSVLIRFQGQTFDHLNAVLTIQEQQRATIDRLATQVRAQQDWQNEINDLFPADDTVRVSLPVKLN